MERQILVPTRTKSLVHWFVPLDFAIAPESTILI
jgi:hypothetical protein